MKKGMYAVIMVSFFIGMSAMTAADECPNCPKTALSSPLDPGWQDYMPPPLAPGESPDCHRVQFGKQACIDCHKKDTPLAYKQWLGSKHGINNVKCGVCHGDAANYRAMPDKAVCVGCHSQQSEQMPAQGRVTNCSFCHQVHWFTVHKIDKYKQFAPDRELKFKVPGF